MYWTDVGTDRIEKSTMDGNSRTTLISTGLSNTYGLTLDYNSQTLYWADYSYNRIESSNVNGSNRRSINYARDPWGITFYAGVLYWTDTYYDRVYSYSVTSQSSAPLTGYLGNSPYGIRVISEESQPLGENYISSFIQLIIIVGFVSIVSKTLLGLTNRFFHIYSYMCVLYMAAPHFSSAASIT